MLNRPLIMGSKGGMGQRYAAILKHLGIDHIGVDAGDGMPERGSYDSVIVATPTYMHAHHIRRVWDDGVPILSEKPLSTDLVEVLELCRDAEKDGVKLRMVNQYAELVPPGASGDTSYNYFRHGADGLAWDCISIVGLANGPVALAESSPVWRCQINGRKLDIADMDSAYVMMIRGWLSGYYEDLNYIRKAHLKVREYLDSCQRAS